MDAYIHCLLTSMIAIVDYDMGNIRSLQNALDFLGAPSVVTRDQKRLASADKIILPGVGAFDLAMNNLKKYRLISVLNELVIKKKKKILGICLGMQLLAQTGKENGTTQGLGWIRGTVKKMKGGPKYRLPHIGFNSISIRRKNNALFRGIEEGTDFYFVHSYVLAADDTSDVAALTRYAEPFVSSVTKGNIYGIQFHPEKSQSNGLTLLKNFISL